ncbi:MAG: amidohydrolase, partial [Flavisolibacter sp.]
MKKAGSLLFACGVLLFTKFASAQSTFPENGVGDPRHGHYAFTNATIVKDATTTVTNATLIIKDGKIVSVGTNLKVPQGAVEVNCSGKYIYPSFIDIYADYGTTPPQRQQGQGGGGFNPGQQPQLNTATKGAYGWNQAIKSEADAFKVFTVDEAKAKPLRDLGFGTVLSHVRDGIARGTGTLV